MGCGVGGQGGQDGQGSRKFGPLGTTVTFIFLQLYSGRLKAKGHFQKWHASKIWFPVQCGSNPIVAVSSFSLFQSYIFFLVLNFFCFLTPSLRPYYVYTWTWTIDI